MLQAQAKAAVTDEAMHKVYDEAVKTMSGEQEVHARHILVATEDEAKAIVAELKKGTDFAELAKQKSKDPGAAAEGGDLGYFGKDQMVPEFAEAAFKLNKGEVSEPVKTQFGWHIIKVEDKRTRAMPEFDKVKDQIATFVARKAQTDFIAHLRETAKIERLDAPAPAPSAAARPLPLRRRPTAARAADAEPPGDFSSHLARDPEGRIRRSKGRAVVGFFTSSNCLAISRPAPAGMKSPA